MATVARVPTGSVGLNHENRRFEPLLPAIERIAVRAFHRLRAAERADRVAEVVARAYMMFRRLVARGLDSLVYASALARFSIRQVIAGRRVGIRQNVRDVLSEAAQRKHRFCVSDAVHHHQRAWEEMIVDSRANPAEIAICRLDFTDWLSRLRRFDRKVATRLARGDRTSEAASYFGVSPARISQLRRELEDSWMAYQGELASNPA